MVTSSPTCIALTGDFIQKELLADEVLSPGHLLEVSAAGKWQKHSTANTRKHTAFAEAKLYEGKEITDAYADGDSVIGLIFPPGAEVVARVAAGATAIVVGDPLTPAADGTLKKATVGTHELVATALEAIDNSGGGTEVFIRVIIL